MFQLSNEIIIQSVLATTGAGTSDVTGSEVDMSGADGVLFIAKFGTAAANNLLHAEQDSATGMGSAADLEDSAVAVGSSDEIVWLDVFRPQERFVRCIAQCGTSTTVDWGIALKYNLRNKPADNATAGTIAGALLISPAEGTK
jgi:hypothetical protein